jgi:hypothetical protein
VPLIRIEAIFYDVRVLAKELAEYYRQGTARHDFQAGTLIFGLVTWFRINGWQTKIQVHTRYLTVSAKMPWLGDISFDRTQCIAGPYFLGVVNDAEDGQSGCRRYIDGSCGGWKGVVEDLSDIPASIHNEKWTLN